VIGKPQPLKEKQLFSDKQHILLWYLSVWDEIVGVLQDIFISDTVCRILFFDEVNINVPLPDSSILRLLQRSHGKLIGICKTNNPARRYNFSFYENHTVNDHSTAIHCKNDEEIAALEALNGTHVRHGIRAPRTKYHRDQRQLYSWMGRA